VIRRTRSAVLLAGLVIANPLVAQQAGPLQRANALINQGQPAQAIPILDSLTTAQPDLAQAWGLLGAALLAARKIDRAIPALERAITFPRIRPPSLYNLGLALSYAGRMDDAFARLKEASATGRIDMTQLGTDPDAELVRADPRYPTLLPTAADYAAPFVEKVRILNEWDGDSTGDQFGWIARDVGDVDGDGIHDVVTSAPTAHQSAGVVYLYSTRTNARVWSVAGHAGDQLGLGVEGAGDVNADGVPDVVAGAPGGDYTLLLSGRDGAVIQRLAARQPGELFGRKVGAAGDQNGDGHADVLIGAPLNDAVAQDAGRVYLVSGLDGSDLRVYSGEGAGHRFGDAVAGVSTPAPGLLVIGAPGVPGGGRTYVYRGTSLKPAFTIEADSTGVQLGGMFVSVVGDVDGDGVPDAYASDWPNRALGPSTGRIYVYSGATGRPLHVLTGEGPGQGFGIGVANAGDVNKDGHDDLVIGAWQFAGAAASGGKVYLYSGADGTLLGAVTGRVMGETLGFDATGLGDVNGDGVPDMLVTSAWSAIHGTRSGRVLVLSGADLLKAGAAR
jgi:Tetratricopeptide repeat/FG-GAP repeat/FG-GAP-like repeat